MNKKQIKQAILNTVFKYESTVLDMRAVDDAAEAIAILPVSQTQAMLTLVTLLERTMSQVEQIRLLEEIRDLLKEVRDNTKPAPVIIGPPVSSSKEWDGYVDLTLCNCLRNKYDGLDTTRIAWTCPVHGYMTC